MFSIGDLMIYSTHGICKVEDICEKTVAGITRMYYVLHPLENSQQLTISTPVDNNKVVMLDLVNKEEAPEILNSFQYPGIEWADNPNRRRNLYTEIIHSGKRLEISKVINTLMRKDMELKRIDKKLHQQDSSLLSDTKNVL